jgi:transcription elongation factor GreA
MDRYPMTTEGHQSLTAELKHLTTVERPKISKEIGIAREHGDLRENAEYHAAKEKQGMIEARIAHIEGVIARAEVIDKTQMGGERVRFGARVTLEDSDSGDVKTFRIVGPEEADLSKGTVSVTAPMARACINHEVGDEVRVQAPGGTKTYEIVDLQWT